MVDLALMAKLVRALRPDARLVLLGDKDQLASVEAGAVLGDVCGDVARLLARRSRAAVAAIAGEPCLPAGGGAEPRRCATAVVLLRQSRRFAPGSGIARLAAAMNRGDGDAALAVLAAGADDVAWRPVTDARAARPRWRPPPRRLRGLPRARRAGRAPDEASSRAFGASASCARTGRGPGGRRPASTDWSRTRSRRGA